MFNKYKIESDARSWDKKILKRMHWAYASQSQSHKTGRHMQSTP